MMAKDKIEAVGNVIEGNGEDPLVGVCLVNRTASIAPRKSGTEWYVRKPCLNLQLGRWALVPGSPPFKKGDCRCQ